jgi:hypothetical protein
MTNDEDEVPVDLNMADELWVWVTEYPDGSIGTVGGIIPGMSMVPLMGRSEHHVRRLEYVANSHAIGTGQRVWLRRYAKAEDFPDLVVNKGERK